MVLPISACSSFSDIILMFFIKNLPAVIKIIIPMKKTDNMVKILSKLIEMPLNCLTYV